MALEETKKRQGRTVRATRKAIPVASRAATPTATRAATLAASNPAEASRALTS